MSILGPQLGIQSDYDRNQDVLSGQCLINSADPCRSPKTAMFILVQQFSEEVNHAYQKTKADRSKLAKRYTQIEEPNLMGISSLMILRR